MLLNHLEQFGVYSESHEKDRKLDRFFSRTLEHIHRVQKNMLKLVQCRDQLRLSIEDCRILMYNVFQHDRSKFSNAQFEAYVELTEYYFQRKTLGDKSYEYPPGWKQKVELAVEDHYRSENHHPEMFVRGSLGKWDKFAAYECGCDLQAMADEFDEGSARGYYDNFWKKKQHIHFYDDFNWYEVQYWMEEAFTIFEKS